MKIFYKDIELDILDQVYEPREDSILLADQLNVKKGMNVLDIGTGCGIQAIVSAKQGASVVATDINPNAIECAKQNAEKNNVEIEFRQGDLFEPITEKFDLIIFNAPYLKEESAPAEKQPIDDSYAGAGKINEFLEQYKNYLKPDGSALLVYSSLSGIEVTGEIIATKKVAFEEIFVIKLNARN
ncbi:MAG: methyltransferase [Candidatus Undinarchaeales archaeon]|jgi:release factor glutamine methyltransferase|nr:methyltransferase [Candidatus Undinarchaeales archaeon]